MMLCDAGPLDALLDAGQAQNHARCTAALAHIALPLVTTWPCFTEAMYLLGRDLGYLGQEGLWQLHASGKLRIHELSEAEADRMQALMAQYRGIPMDLADASLVAAAETLGVRRIFTLDSHFYAYRTADGQAKVQGHESI
jgi:predicted nucleic acid-binding protein